MEKKRHLRVLTVKNGFALRLEDRLVYSWLTFLARYHKGSNKAGLAKALGFSRTHTVPACLARLMAMGLIDQREGRYYAKPAPEEWFSYSARSGEWYERVKYWRFPLPENTCPLSTQQIAVYAQLRCQNCAHSVSRIAGRLGIERTTVRAALRRLEEIGLVRDKYHVLPLAEAQLSWFRDKPLRICNKVPAMPYVEHYASLIETLNETHPEMAWRIYFKQLEKQACSAGYPFQGMEDVIVSAAKVLKTTTPTARFLTAMPDWINRAEQRNDRQKYPTSFGLFKKLVKDYLKQNGKKR